MRYVITQNKEVIEVINLDEWTSYNPKVFFRFMTNEEIKNLMEGKRVKKKFEDGIQKTFIKVEEVK